CPLRHRDTGGRDPTRTVLREEASIMKRIIQVLAITLIGLAFSACGNNPPTYSQGDTNAPASEEAQAQQPSVNQ
ncbi:MAG: hypothetical protein ACREWG_07680, partial [Gammaproteobacteria bacterium]